MKFDKAKAKKPKRAYIPAGVYGVRITAANQYKVQAKSSAENPDGVCLCLLLRFDAVEGQPLLPHDVPEERQWMVGQILEATLGEDVESCGEALYLSAADIVGKKVVVQIADWTPPEKEEPISVIKRYFPLGTTVEEAAEIAAKPPRKKPAGRRPKPETTSEGRIPF